MNAIALLFLRLNKKTFLVLSHGKCMKNGDIQHDDMICNYLYIKKISFFPFPFLLKHPTCVIK